ncbi:MAG: orotate phosphoribosyltransferase [Candidatus Saccharicenans sp.]|nr:MAG: orotate phosphoribosyltransferase [Candidatus Aminicenantes bacterium]HEK85762.1 orotate phosphoribosyltransferase [Candidatus Aminicenantes bacterium]
MPQNRSDVILNLFKESQALLKGHFQLTSGKHSEWYFEKIKLIERPVVLEKIITWLVEDIKNDCLDFDYVVSPAYGGIAIGFLTALKLKKFFAFTQRAEEKMTIRSGFSGLNKAKAIIVEDILTTGGSVSEVLDCLNLREVEVVGIYCLVDRSGGEVLVQGKPVKSLLSLKVEAYEPDSCPLCQQGLPLVKPGASDKR